MRFGYRGTMRIGVPADDEVHAPGLSTLRHIAAAQSHFAHTTPLPP